jgi:hypothetical protein
MPDHMTGLFFLGAFFVCYICAWVSWSVGHYYGVIDGRAEERRLWQAAFQHDLVKQSERYEGVDAI